MRRRGFAALTFGIAASSVAGCAGPGSDDAPTPTPTPMARVVAPLRIWAPPSVQAPLRAAGRRFTRAHPEASIRVVAKSAARIVAAIRSGDPSSAPDIAWLPHEALTTLTGARALAPLALGRLGRALNPLAVAAFTRAGQTFALPCCLSNLALVRNRSLTEAAPATWTEAVGPHAANGRLCAVLQGIGRGGDAYGMFGWQTSFGNTAFALTDDGTIGTDLTMGDQAGQDFATWLFAEGARGLGHLDTALTEEKAQRLFRQGAAPYLLTAERQARALQAGGMDLDVLPIPSAGGQEARPFLQVQGLAVLSASPDQDAAAAFVLEAMGTVPTQVAVATATGQTPALADAMKDSQIVGDVITTGFANAGSNGIPTPSLPQMSEIWRVWGRAEAQIISGASSQKTWTAMADQINRIVGRDG